MTFLDILYSKIKISSQLQCGLLNFITSSCFIWTTLHSYFRGCNDLVIGCLACLTTSWLYHGSRTILFFHQESLKEKDKNKDKNNKTYYIGFFTFITPLFRVLDIIICQFSIIYFTYQCASFNWLYIGTIMAIIYLFLMYYIFETSNRKFDGDLWHSTLHIIANLGISCLIESCLDLEFCRL